MPDLPPPSAPLLTFLAERPANIGFQFTKLRPLSAAKAANTKAPSKAE